MAACTAVCPPVPSDEQLLTRLARGDREALEELFRRYRNLAYRVAHRLLGNEADALDAVQEGFAKALTHLTGLHDRAQVFARDLLRPEGAPVAVPPGDRFEEVHFDPPLPLTLAPARPPLHACRRSIYPLAL